MEIFCYWFPPRETWKALFTKVTECSLNTKNRAEKLKCIKVCWLVSNWLYKNDMFLCEWNSTDLHYMKKQWPPTQCMMPGSSNVEVNPNCGMDKIHLAEDKCQWWAFVSKIRTGGFPKMFRNAWVVEQIMASHGLSCISYCVTLQAGTSHTTRLHCTL